MGLLPGGGMSLWPPSLVGQLSGGACLSGPRAWWVCCLVGRVFLAPAASGAFRVCRVLTQLALFHHDRVLDPGSLGDGWDAPRDRVFFRSHLARRVLPLQTRMS